MMRWKNLEFDARDIFAAVMTMAVILFLVYNRVVMAGKFFDALAAQDRTRAESFAKIEAKLDEIRARLPPPLPKGR
jgi:hypothetical protein